MSLGRGPGTVDSAAEESVFPKDWARRTVQSRGARKVAKFHERKWWGNGPLRSKGDDVHDGRKEERGDEVGLPGE